MPHVVATELLGGLFRSWPRHLSRIVRSAPGHAMQTLGPKAAVAGTWSQGRAEPGSGPRLGRRRSSRSCSLAPSALR